MGYKTIQHGGRYIIVNEYAYGLEKGSTSNLNENELKIVFLEVQDCPADNDICVFGIGMERTDYHVNSICKCMGFYPTRDEKDKLIIEKLSCNHKNSPGDLKVKLLNTERCPINKLNCLECSRIENVIVPPQGNPDKSHAHLVCGKIEKKS